MPVIGRQNGPSRPAAGDGAAHSPGIGPYESKAANADYAGYLLVDTFQNNTEAIGDAYALELIPSGDNPPLRFADTGQQAVRCVNGAVIVPTGQLRSHTTTEYAYLLHDVGQADYTIAADWTTVSQDGIVFRYSADNDMYVVKYDAANDNRFELLEFTPTGTNLIASSPVVTRPDLFTTAKLTLSGSDFTLEGQGITWTVTGLITRNPASTVVGVRNSKFNNGSMANLRVWDTGAEPRADLFPYPEPRHQKDTYRVADWLNSIGGNVHLERGPHQSTGASQMHALANRIKAFMRVWRTGSPRYTSQQAGLSNFAQAVSGVQFCVITDPNTYDGFSRVDAAKMRTIDDLLGNRVAYWQITNEPDNFGADGPWAYRTREHTRLSAAEIRADAQLQNAVILGAPMVKGYSPLGRIGEYIDYGAFHPYAHGGHPMFNFVKGAHIAKRASWEKGLVCTEWGYNDSMQTSDQTPIDRAAMPKAQMRGWIENYYAGSPLNCIYQVFGEHESAYDSYLTENDQEKGFRMVHRLPGDTYKELPTFIGAESVGIIMDEPNDGYTVTPLSATASGNNVRILKLEHSDGSYYIWVWRHAVWRNDAAADVTVNFGATFDYEVYRPVADAFCDVDDTAAQQDGRTARSSGNASSLTLSIDAEPKLIKLL